MEKIPLTAAAKASLSPHSTAPEDMLPTSSYMLSGTEPPGYVRVVARNIRSHDHATTTINSLVDAGWTSFDLSPEAF